MRLRQIALVARDLARASDDLTAVLGLGAPFADPGVAVFGLHNAVFPLGDTFLEVVSPVEADTSAGRFLDRRGGDAGYMVIVQSDDRAADRRRVNELGVRIVWETALPDISTIHLHPRDVGGAILSLDVPLPPEAWRWAGPGWQERSRVDVATGLVAAELHSFDPAALASRWAGVLGRDVAMNRDGGAEIALDRGRLRFAANPDAAAAGLAAFDVAVSDRDRVFAEARRRGLVGTDGAIRICGTTVKLVAA